MSPHDPGEAELIAAGALQRTRRALERGEDPKPFLSRVPAGTRLEADAHHLRAAIARAEGDSANAEAALAALASARPEYARRHQVAIARADLALAKGDWEAAETLLQEADADWRANRAQLDRLSAGGEFDPLWKAWENDSSWGDRVPLDPRPLARARVALHEAAVSLPGTVDASIGAEPLIGAILPPPDAANAWGVDLPGREQREALRAAEDQALAARAREAELSWQIERERESLSARARYFATGEERLERERAELERLAARADSLAAELDLLLAQLQGVRDAALRNFAERTARMLRRTGENLRWIGAMEHFYVRGPHRSETETPPEGYPTPPELLIAERALAEKIARFAAAFAEKMPGIIDRSHREVWAPGLVAAVQNLANRAAGQLAYAERIGAGIDSTDAFYARGGRLQGLLAARTDAEREARDRTAAAEVLKRDTAARAVERAIERLQWEREGIDYALCASAYGRSVGPGAAVRTDEPLTAEAKARTAVAAARLQAFLDAYPQSPARGDARFRLADLLLVQARGSFLEQMAQRVQLPGSDLAVPFVDTEPAAALYRSILAEDTGFAHRDAARFHLGVILTEQGNPAAADEFAAILRESPGSIFAQEAHLRLGDIAFEGSDYATAQPHYEQATSGAEPSIAAIAFYKIGWSRFHEDRFEEATVAFLRLMDLYSANEGRTFQPDLRKEAEEYLVHALARAGGAEVFVQHFGPVPTRAYEPRILRGVAQLYRRSSLYLETVEADRLWLSRYPEDPEALAVAQDWIESLEMSERPEQAEQARLDLASLFLADGRWMKANAGAPDSVRAAASRFARDATLHAGVYHHQKARALEAEGPTEAATAQWSRALEIYATLLERHPDDPEAGRFHLYSGEAAAHLGRHDEALAHYTIVADGSGPEARDAEWQRVAILDKWYESTRTASPSGPGDSVRAQALLAAEDRFRERHADDPRGADLLWRAGNVALAHAWYDRAASDFGTLAAGYPEDPRAIRAATLRGDMLLKAERWEPAGLAYEDALLRARQAKDDSLATRLVTAIPYCEFRHAEEVAAAAGADSTAHRESTAAAARLYEKLALRWPQAAQADPALYRSGLAYIEVGAIDEGVRALETLLETHPKSELARDAHLKIAAAHESAGSLDRAAGALQRFSGAYPDDADAGNALLHSADLEEKAGDKAGAERIRLQYIEKHPGDVESAMEIFGDLATAELAGVTPERPVSILLRKPSAKTGDTGSHLNRYLGLAEKHAEQASPVILAQVDFLRGEEARAGYEQERLGQPIVASIEKKKKKLEEVLGHYRACVQRAAAPWNHAAASRIGEVLVHFGDALHESERPAELTGADLTSYEDVIDEEAWHFYDAGEQAWEEALRVLPKEAADEAGWIAGMRTSLWSRLGERFAFLPAVDYPVLSAQAPARELAKALPRKSADAQEREEEESTRGR
jgi:TolA-binding protein